MALNSKTISVDDLVLQGIVNTLEDSDFSWSGTMTELSSELGRSFNRNKSKRSVLPGSPSALRVVINRITNRLRSRGISVRFKRSPDHTRTRFVTFVW